MSNINRTPALRSRLEFYIMNINPTDPIPESECSICTEAMVTDVVRIATCGHHFHVACILCWLQGNERRNRTCPNCRTELYEAQLMPQASATGSRYDITFSSVPRTHYATYVMLRPARPDERNHHNLRFGYNALPTAVQARDYHGAEATFTSVTPFSHAGTVASPPTYNIRTRNNPYGPETQRLARLRARQASHQEYRREIEALAAMSTAGSYRDWSQTQTRGPANVARAPVPQISPLTWLNSINAMTNNGIDSRPSQANQALPVVQRTVPRRTADDRARMGGLETQYQHRRLNDIVDSNAAALVDNSRHELSVHQQRTLRTNARLAEITAILRARQPEE